ncbi:alpha/beta fold hydrolase [Chitinophaga rhizophila]|uniref:Alpha/beta hydrolase n=1 Tax=Chitinophaga rhizophila TaxID=2866212 RepID=A0ABS7GJ56_9BACT|nr:alpha/beta fold hydrolase [Chitinophaga rhizophila]MBW8687170.1 alpha/beta hydrolase [Chitinophaga rhizophila]
MRRLLIITFLLCAFLDITAQQFTPAASFYPHAETLKKDPVTYGYFSVPENWDVAGSKQIKMAVAILKNKAGIANPEAVVFLQGGPGAGSIQNIFSWLTNPLREKNDIILLDIRGTGFSQPRLCPDLGKAMLNIYASNESAAADEAQKVKAVLSCKQEMLAKGIDVNAYHSQSVAKDLHALKTYLKYTSWNVYGVSYGTYMAMVYASLYPADLTSLILDSPVADVDQYYVKNTGNYMRSLNKVFQLCKNDPATNRQYPDLERVYYETIDALEKAPITVKVDKSVLPAQYFTYNAADFKLAIQQALYHKQLVEVIPLLIYQFHNRSEGPLSNLVSTFSNLLGMDYGVYYCVSCNEVLPNNSYTAYQQDAAAFPALNGGLSFYQSDFNVCRQWKGAGLHHDLSALSAATYPVLVFSGGYDPITPAANGEAVVTRFPDAHLVKAPTFGHVPSFSKIGGEVLTAFVGHPGSTPDSAAFKRATQVTLVKDVAINGGIVKMGTSLNRLDPIFLAPLTLAFVLMLAFVCIYSFRLLRKKYYTLPDSILRIMACILSLVALVAMGGLVYALTQTAAKGFVVMAFGLPAAFSWIFTLIYCFIVLLLLTYIYFFLRIKKISNRSILFSVIFSNSLFAIYLLYWGVL